MKVLLLLLVMMPTLSWAAVAIETPVGTPYSFIGSTAGDTVSFPFTCTSNNTALYVAVQIRETNAVSTTVTALTYNSLTLANFTSVAAFNTPVSTGSNTLQLTTHILRAFPGALCNGAANTLTVMINQARFWGASATSVHGVNLADANGTAQMGATHGTPNLEPVTPAISTAVGDVVLGWMSGRNTNSISTDAPSTSLYNFVTGSGTGSLNVRGRGAWQAGVAGSVTMAWSVTTGTAQEWIAVGLNVKALTATATYWVATTGNDSNSCSAAQSESTPRLTITLGAACLTTPGSTLKIKAGTYAEQLTNAIPGGTVSAPVTVMADAGAAVTIAPGAGQDGGIYFTTAASQYIVLDGLVLDGAAETNGHGIIIDTDAHHITVRNTTIRNFWNQGILVSVKDGTPDVAVANNNLFSEITVHNNGRNTGIAANQQHGIYIETDNNLIDGCYVYNHTGHGIHIFSAHDVLPNDNTITRCYVENTGTIGVGLYGTGNNKLTNSAVYGSGAAGVKLSGTAHTVDNNTLYDNVIGIFADTSSGTNHVIRNNIIANHEDYGIWLRTGVTGVTVQYTQFYNPTGTDFLSEGGITPTNTQTGDPLFQDPTNGGFYLQAGSPAINTALNIGLTTDCCGTVRPQGAGYDRGALEFLESTTPRRPTGLQYRFLQLFDRLWRFS